MSVASTAASAAQSSVQANLKGRSRDKNPKSILFLAALWFSLFFGVVVLLALILDTAIAGAPRLDGELFTNYESRINRDETGFRAGILGSVWLMVTTAILAIPLGIGAAVHLEEFADSRTWYNRLVEVNLQNLAAVPSIIYGMLAVAIMGLLGFTYKGIVLGGAIALALLILPVVIITTREAIRAVPEEIRQGSLALGATVWQTTWRNTLPSAVPGIATGTILGLSRAIGEAAPLIILGLAVVREDPAGLLDKVVALPIQIFQLSSESHEEYQIAASAAIIVLLAMILGMNALAIFIRNKFQRSW
ncbi:phosphate ABC transporter permease PstA [Nocardioides ferulae]|uniref:phosphate ABC transporter permease PstA n=1 Tax=Nocardioides ferulae TaxID=2340821 RepID=UPI000EB2AECD|nr:phosphate ABC transporter permease PstA [Nocardioides ferulae]